VHWRRFRIDGRVQGVGFRAFVLRQALRLGLVGEVWNGQDGSVGCMAGHEASSSLDEFEQRLWTGPGHVTGVRSEPAQQLPGADSFFIVPSPTVEWDS